MKIISWENIFQEGFKGDEFYLCIALYKAIHVYEIVNVSYGSPDPDVTGEVKF